MAIIAWKRDPFDPETHRWAQTEETPWEGYTEQSTTTYLLSDPQDQLILTSLSPNRRIGSQGMFSTGLQVQVILNNVLS